MQLQGLAGLDHLARRVVTHHHRTMALAEPSLVLAAVPVRTALVREGGSWRCAGAGSAQVFLAGEERGLDVLPA